MRPQFHNLKGNAGTETPSNLLFFDCESYEKKSRAKDGPKLLSWRLACAIALRIERGAVTRRQVLQTKSQDEFWEFVESRQCARTPLWLFAHNAHFDCTQANFWKRLESREYTVGPLPGNGKDERVRGKKEWRGKLCLEAAPFFMQLMGRVGPVTICDTSNYWPHALYKIGERFNLPKGNLPKFSQADSTWFRYCLRDCEILEVAILDLLKKWRAADLGVFQKTAAALAMQTYRHTEIVSKRNPNGYTIAISHDKELSELERLAYYGGYTAPFYVGYIAPMNDMAPVIPSLNTGNLVPCPIGPLVKIDCNGLYPWVMKEGLFPFRRLPHKGEITPNELKEKAKACGACAEVVLNTWTGDYPLRYEGHLQYACGKFTTYLCGDELKRALESNHVSEVRRCCFYSLNTLFREFIEHWNTRKIKAHLEDDAAEKEFCKLIMNSLYGKFAQKSFGWKDSLNADAQEQWGQWPVIYEGIDKLEWRRAIGGIVQVKEEGDELPHVFPAISGFVTAAGREYMRKIHHLCPERTVYYQGVDSLIISIGALAVLDSHDLLHDYDLGKFRVEQWAEEGEIFGSNWYRLDKDTVHSGHWGKAKVNQWGEHYAECWQGVATTVNTEPDGTIAVNKVKVSKDKPYVKGLLTDDNWLRLRELIPVPEVFQPTTPKRGKQEES